MKDTPEIQRLKGMCREWEADCLWVRPAHSVRCCGMRAFACARMHAWLPSIHIVCVWYVGQLGHFFVQLKRTLSQKCACMPACISTELCGLPAGEAKLLVCSELGGSIVPRNAFWVCAVLLLRARSPNLLCRAVYPL